MADAWVLVSDSPITSYELDPAKAQAGVSSYYLAGPVVMLAKLTGADTLMEIADWAADRAAWLCEQWHVSWRRMPHHSTFRRLFEQALPLTELEQQARAFLTQRQADTAAT